MSVNSVDFRKELIKILECEKEQGKEFIEISSKELHEKVGGYPSRNHRMKSCCNVMLDMMNINDEIIKSPLKGYGATLVIKYFVI